MCKKILLSLFAFLMPLVIFAQDENGIDKQIDETFGWLTGWFVNLVFWSIPITDAISIPLVLIILVLGAIYFTIYFGFVNFTKFGTAINVVRGKYDDLETGGGVDVSPDITTDRGDLLDTIRIEGEHGKGEVTHFQALTAALSGTVGLGNIAGVAIAISVGGAGATFWMILAGIIGMASKFTECTLGVKFREIGPDGTVYGGPMYYLKKGLEAKGLGFLGKIAAGFFAVMCIGGSFGGGNMFQANQAFQLFQHVTGGEESFIAGYGWLFGLIMAIFVGIVIIGGIKSIAKVTDKVVPGMVVVYVLASIIVLIVNAGAIPNAIGEIFSGAFGTAGMAGGFIGVLIQGVQRAAFSNEAGIGSASIAHSAVKTDYAASEGLVAMLEPFIDTVVICTMTALVIIVTGAHTQGAIGNYSQGAIVTANSFGTVMDFFPYILTLAVVLFAFSTMISWSYYGYQAWSYLFGRSKGAEYAYKSIFCLFVIIGSAASLGSVIAFSDAMIFAMMFPNMIGLVILAPYVKEELDKYLKAIKKSDA